MWLYTACGEHLFKSSTGNDACRACPRDSDTDKMASVECRCRRLFYRSPSEAADTPCTRLIYWSIKCYCCSRKRCRRKPEAAPPSERQPVRSQIFDQFSDDLFVVVILKTTLLVLTLQLTHLYWPIYLALSNMAVPLHRQIKPFNTNRSLLEPFQGPFTPW